MAKLAGRCDRLLDIGALQQPNPYLQGAVVAGLDLITPPAFPPGYTEWVEADAAAPSLANPSLSFDAVVAGEILEHLERPMDALRAWNDLLRPGGRLVLSTPNPHSPIEQLLTLSMNRRWFYTEEHITLFPQRWLVRMLERANYTDVRLYSGGFPVPWLGLVPWPRPWCYQTIAIAVKPRSRGTGDYAG